MAQSNFYGNDYDARYQANNYNFEKVTKFKRHKDDYRTS